MKKGARPNIAFAGLTAAGKTTHAKVLANQLGYEYVSATNIILDILEIKQRPDRIWFSQYDKIEKARECDAVDIELERRLTEIADNRDGLVLDTWAMAYIYQGPLIRIWMESDEDSRTRKCYVSQGDQKNLNIARSGQLVNQKDNDTRDKFKRRLGFDLFTDKSRYDAIICNTDLIPNATDSSARQGITSFSPVVHDVADFLVRKTIGFCTDLKAMDIIEKYDSMVLRLSESPWSFKEGIWKS